MRNLSEPERQRLKAEMEDMRSLMPALEHASWGGLSERGQAQFLQWFERILRQNHAVGAAMVLVYPDGQVQVFCYGKARRHPVVMVEHDTCFRIASITKLVSTFGILSLAEAGILSLDEDISRYMGYEIRHPGFPKRCITLRMLLTHTAGIRNVDPLVVQAEPAEMRFRNPSIWRETEPGNSFLYSNLGAGLAGAVAESAAGCLFDTIMQKRVFRPLGICAAYGAANMPKDRTVANGYSVRWPLPVIKKYDALRQARQERRERPGESLTTTVGRVITDPAGMAAFSRLLASGRNTDVLDTASIEEMRRCQDGIGGIECAGRGLNVSFLENVVPGFPNLVGHQGVAYGMCSELFTDPDSGYGVGIMMNGVQLDRHTIQTAGARLLALGFGAFR